MISPGFVQDALQSLVVAGRDPAPLLRGAGMTGAPDEMVPADRYGRLWWLIAAEIGDEFFGHGARPMRPGSFEMLCRCAIQTRTLQQALERSLTVLAIVLDDPRGVLSVENGTATIVLQEQGPPRAAFAYRTFWVILMGVACWLVGRRFPLRGLEFRSDEPAGRDDCHRFFGAPVRFGAAHTVLRLDAALLRLPVIRDERALTPFLQGAPGNILLRFRHDRGIAARIVDRLGHTDPGEWPDLHMLAGELRLSPATLRRRLRADGQSLSAIKAELRGRLAQRLLADGALSVAEVARAVGYSEPSAFYRAYTKWSGGSPRAEFGELDQTAALPAAPRRETELSA